MSSPLALQCDFWDSERHLSSGKGSKSSVSSCSYSWNGNDSGIKVRKRGWTLSKHIHWIQGVCLGNLRTGSLPFVGYQNVMFSTWCVCLQLSVSQLLQVWGHGPLLKNGGLLPLGWRRVVPYNESIQLCWYCVVWDCCGERRQSFWFNLSTFQHSPMLMSSV